MKKFKFGLQPVLTLRERREEKIKLQYAEKIQQIAQAQKTQTDIVNQLKRLQDEEKQNRADANNIMKLRYSVSHRFKLKQDILAISRKIDDLKAEAFRIQQKLTVAARDRRAVEIVKEHQLQAWKKEYRLSEQGFIDDISQQSFIRKSNSKAQDAM